MAVDRGANIEPFLDSPGRTRQLIALASWATAGLKLGNALPNEWASRIVLTRLADPGAVRSTVAKRRLHVGKGAAPTLDEEPHP